VREAIILDFADSILFLRRTVVMKKIMLLIVCALLTGLSVGSIYAGVEPTPWIEKSFDPQPEPPGISQATNPIDGLVTLSDGRKLEFLQSGKKRQVYLIQKNGTRALADGDFTLPNGQKLTIFKGSIVQGK
jgi:hypothetical protein